MKERNAVTGVAITAALNRETREPACRIDVTTLNGETLHGLLGSAETWEMARNWLATAMEARAVAALVSLLRDVGISEDETFAFTHLFRHQFHESLQADGILSPSENPSSENHRADHR